MHIKRLFYDLIWGHIYTNHIFFYIFLCKEDVKRNILYAINLNQSDDIQNQNVNDDLTLNLIFFLWKIGSSEHFGESLMLANVNNSVKFSFLFYLIFSVQKGL